jgi:hypothetical protein
MRLADSIMSRHCRPVGRQNSNGRKRRPMLSLRNTLIERHNDVRRLK